MKTIPTGILYSRDEDLSIRFVRMSSRVIALQPVDAQADLEQRFIQMGDTILLADLRAPNCLEMVSQIRQEFPLSIVIAIGSERSDPMLIAETLGLYATIPSDPDGRDLRSLIEQAAESLNLRIKNRLLTQELATLSARQSETRPEPRTLFSAPLQNFSKAQRNVDNLEMLFESVVDGLVATARVSRAGIFMRPDAESAYVYRAGTRCLSTTEKLQFPSNDPFIRWMEMNTHLVSRSTLKNIPDPEDRAMLKRMLDSLGAEIIIPLYATGTIKGWIFVGQRSTGIPFDVADLEDMTALADHISTTLEKALQYEETALQKALAETLLHSIPFGIIACDENAMIRWFNSTARHILDTENTHIIGQRAEELGSRIADMLHRAIAQEEIKVAHEWTDVRTKRTLSAETRSLLDDGKCVGAMMMLHDVTGAKLLQEKEEQLERAAFWNELASSMSHEIRNPLVAIKTFSQLLPARYEDPDFRADFSQQVTAEVDQLNHIIDKINEFANPPKPIFLPIDIRKPIEFAVTRIQSEFEHENLKIHLSSDESDLEVNGDAASLEECIYHLLRNSAENLGNKPGSRLNVSVKGRSNLDSGGLLYVMVTDNGSGIEPSLRDKVFSPFSTTKARGMGLGLPIAKRAVIDHNGRIDIETSSGGTTITIVIPSAGPVPH
ncbi:MAG: PAS domain-containing protein [Pontiellaceae bacterium]|nr:PAS domain-containing protein [Pontiellaceae bacterium]MBN2785463.1 PAS domain-containing protein [Pontiellaceae bacterium]